MQTRSQFRSGLKVLHRHRIGTSTFRRVSELIYIASRPRAILGWVDMGGVRTPIYQCELDPAKLRKGEAKNTYYYDGVTVDPRYEDASAAAEN